MNREELLSLLQGVAGGQTAPEEAARLLRDWPEGRMQSATLDHHRSLRTGFPEVIFGQGKSVEQLLEIGQHLMERGRGGLYTRLDAARGQALLSRWPESEWHPRSGLLMLPGPRPAELVGEIAVICAGTSDLPVAEEAALVARYAGHRVVQYTDVGVAGLHRLLSRIEAIRKAHALIVVAGMEGALPSVVAGLVDRPIIAVPTSVGYGASFGGLAALLAMLNACAPGVTVVNIDNGFGAAVVATQINRLALGAR